MNPSLYYDGECPLCKREISLLKRLSKNRLNFVDVHQAHDKDLPSKDLLLKRLHLRKENGEWLIGLDANVYAWSMTPYGVLFKVLRLWPVRPVADFIYTRWADRRFAKRYQCNQCKM